VTEQLPPGARARLSQAAEGHTWTSSLSVNEFAALKATGFEPIGQVMGSAVHNLGWWYGGRMDCGRRGGLFTASTAITITSGMQGAWSGYGMYIKTLYQARHAAMGRMAAECAALGGDGVVGVRLEVVPFMGAAHHLEFQAFGTAIRAQGDMRPGRPFLSHLSGQDFAKLIETGWVPVDLVMGSSIGIRHDDWRTQWSGGRFAPNQEVAGWTDLVARTRNEARHHLLIDTARTGAEGVVLDTADFTVHERECQYAEGQRDHTVETTFIGTAVVAFQKTHQPQRALKIMRV
jgi:uncharacterized protein YbjQ (UPF0145 family)